MLRLDKFTWHDDGNEHGLAVAFKSDLQNVNYTVRNAVTFGWFADVQATANALRELARWCETLEYNERRKDDKD